MAKAPRTGAATLGSLVSRKDFEEDDDESTEYIQVVRKSIVPINDLVDNISKLKKLEANEKWVIRDYREAHLLDGVDVAYQPILVDRFNTAFELTHLFKQGMEHVYVPLIYRVCSTFFQLDSKETCLTFLKELDVVNVIQTFNKTLVEVEPVLKSNFSGVNIEEVIVDLFSQSYIHNFIELQNLFKTINSEL